MGLRSKPRPLFTQKFVNGLKRVPESAMAAIIEIFTETKTYDVETDTWTEATTTLYFGEARVQPLRGASEGDQTGDAALIQTFLFSIPIANKSLDLRTDMVGRVVDAPLNPVLLRYQFHITEVTDSSNPVEKTFYAQFNSDVTL